jgi:hypothetical protein
MEINAENYIKIMKVNFEFPIVETILGKGVKINPFKAFIYSSITGAGYLDNPIYPFSLKGLLKVFYNAMDYKFVTGLFDNTTLKNTPYILSKAKPFLFDTEKIIIPVDFCSELELQNKLDIFIKTIKEKSTKYLIQRIEKSKKGNGMEPFMEYLTCETLKENGFIVENQIPLTYSSGSPDFGGYRLKNISGILPNQIHLLELSMIRLGWENQINNFNDNWVIVGEAKTSCNRIKKQLTKYLNTGFFNEAFVINPNIQAPSTDYNTLLTIDDNYKIQIIESKKTTSYCKPINQKKYIQWLNNYLKYYLLANLTNDELIDFYKQNENDMISCKDDIVFFVNKLSFQQIINRIKDVVEYGSSFKR